MNDDESLLTPDYEDFEEARETETTPLRRPAPPTNWRRWITIVALVVVGSAAFVLAWFLSADVPPRGDAGAEARVAALVTFGATAAGAAVALATVALTLGLQREHEQRRRWGDFQVQVLQEAYVWVEGVRASFGEIMAGMNEAAHAPRVNRRESLQSATQVAQRFYDEGQRLGDVERLERLVADKDVRAALRRADGALRLWNETVAGDHTTRQVAITEAQGTEWDVYNTLTNSVDDIREAYANAVQEAFADV